MCYSRDLSWFYCEFARGTQSSKNLRSLGVTCWLRWSTPQLKAASGSFSLPRLDGTGQFLGRLATSWRSVIDATEAVNGLSMERVAAEMLGVALMSADTSLRDEVQ